MNGTSVIYPLANVNKTTQELHIKRGSGIYVYGSNGRRYLDLNSGLWNVPFGYGDKEYTDAVSEQLSKLHYINMINFSSSAITDLADDLIDFTDNDFEKVIFTCSGSESVECAIKIARKYMYLSDRKDCKTILSMDMSYHGTTYAAMTASGMDSGEVLEYSPLNEKIKYLETPFFPSGSASPEEQQRFINSLEKVFSENDIAAVLLEPVMASGGIISLPDWYIEKLTELIKKYDVLFIVDEVATGFYRTGKVFKYNDLPIKPDILCLSKAITNGIIPMGAVLVNNKMFRCYSDRNEYINNFSTQCGNPLACAAAEKTLSKFTNEIIVNIGLRSEQFRKGLEELKRKNPNIRQIRTEGLMIGIDITDNEGNVLSMDELNCIMNCALQKGLLLYVFQCGDKCSGVTLMPPYTISENETNRVLKILSEII
ncbi:MAG: aspartate aminotransferase family protein [Ruminococcus sp.]|nr:aspartate aminotransferase family protein [Ruminococcus sp.]